MIVQQPVGAGSLYRLEADQEPFYPGQQPAVYAWVEGCGLPDNQGLSLQYAVGDNELFRDIDCHRVVASYDPNDKEAQPQGYEAQHLIEPNTDLTYRIRFQNTGTDTAFNIIVRDTLAPWLDPVSILPEVASHPYTWDIVDGHVLKFTFRNILLPDSNVNESASHGFVQFRVSQRKDLPLGTVIPNTAAIYFDFNPPVITNQTFHTIGHDFVLVSIDDPEDGGPRLCVSPNPFRTATTFEFSREVKGMLLLYNAQGQVLRREPVSGRTHRFERQGLPSGPYTFNLWENGRMAGSGKMMVQ